MYRNDLLFKVDAIAATYLRLRNGDEVQMGLVHFAMPADSVSRDI